MSQTPSGAQRRSFDLTADQTQYIDRLLADGTFASENDVIAAGLQALRDRDDEVERWLREEVVPTYNRMQADPGRGLSKGEVDRRLQARHEERLRAEDRCDER